MAWVTFNCLLPDMAAGAHDFANDALYAVLTNTAPDLTDTILGDIVQISGTGGYGVKTIGAFTVDETDGVLTVSHPEFVWTPSGADFDPARYVAICNVTASNKLVAYTDYGVSYAVPDGVPFTVTASTLFTIRPASA
jgi:hypothetical protein